MYGIELQWEMHPEVTTWGEGQVDCINDRRRLTRKGTTLHPGEVPDECHRWVDVASTNARLVWRSFCPSLLQKCPWYATSSGGIWCNVASVLTGLVHKRYPTNWWRHTLVRCLTGFTLPVFFSWRDLMSHYLTMKNQI